MRNEFTTFMSNHLVEILNTPTATEAEKVQAIGESYQVARRELINMGLRNSTVELVDTIIDNMTETIEKSTAMGLLMTHILNSQKYSAYKAQCLVYTEAVGLIQGYTAPIAFILGRRNKNTTMYI